MTDARLVVMGKRELVSSDETSRVQGKRYEGGGGHMIGYRSAGDVRENGRILENENGECESPAWIDLTTPW